MTEFNNKRDYVRGYKFFFETLIKKGKANAWEVVLTFILFYEMDNYNCFSIDNHFYNKLEKYQETLMGKSNNLRYLRNVVKSLREYDIIIRIKRGKYRVNPKAYWGGKKKDWKQAFEE